MMANVIVVLAGLELGIAAWIGIALALRTWW
jgi:hypothetical protein